MATTVLTRTPSSAGNRRTFTWSFWVKRSNLESSRTLFSVDTASGTTGFSASYFISTGELIISVRESSGAKNLKTNQVFRDVSAWYHIVIAFDTTQSTATDRIKLYVNGSQVTSFAEQNDITQNFDTSVNNTVRQDIGVYKNSSGSLNSYFDGEMSHVHLIDGTAYDASAFGETDATTGEWKINTSPSVTYGTNGFFILKDGNSVTDQSGNSNNFTVGGGTLTNTEDCPANVFATWNPLGALSTPPTFSNGNTTAAIPNSGGVFRSTLAVSSGKYYCEVKLTSLNAAIIGIQPIDSQYNASIFSDTSAIGLYGTGGTIYQNGSNIGDIASVADNDIIGMAIDLDNNNIYFSKNGQYASGISGSWNQTFDNAYAVAINSGHTYSIASQNGGSGTSSNISINFGNGYFGTTAVSSAGTNASGNGIFEYDVPTGFTALSTKGLNL